MNKLHCGVQNESQNKQFTVCVSYEEKNNQFTCIKLVIRINGKYELQETINRKFLTKPAKGSEA